MTIDRAPQARMAHDITDLETLVAEVDHWWFAPKADNSPADLAEGARLHREIEARLARMAAAYRHQATRRYVANQN